MTHISQEERRVLILTGASRGIGHATVKRFSSAGWRVISCSRHAFPENCPWEAGAEDHIQVDLADPDNVIRAIAEMKDRLKAQKGRLSALVNNAAISPKGEGGSRLGSLATRLEDWKAVFQVNFFAPIMLARGLVGELEAASGCVVNQAPAARPQTGPVTCTTNLPRAGCSQPGSAATLRPAPRRCDDAVAGARKFAIIGLRETGVPPNGNAWLEMRAAN